MSLRPSPPGAMLKEEFLVEDGFGRISSRRRWESLIIKAPYGLKVARRELPAADRKRIHANRAA